MRYEYSENTVKASTINVHPLQAGAGGGGTGTLQKPFSECGPRNRVPSVTRTSIKLGN